MEIIRLRCNKCKHEWEVKADKEGFWVHTKCSKCNSRGWSWIIKAMKPPEIPDDHPGLEPWKECPSCGASQPQVDDSGLHRLLYQRCQKCGHSERADKA